MYLKAIAIFLFIALSLKASNHMEKGFTPKATLKYQAQLEKITAQYGENSPKRIESLVNLGSLYIEIEDLDSAKKYLEEAHMLYLKADSSEYTLDNVVILWKCLGYVYHETFHYEQSLIYYQKALELYELLDSNQPNTISIINILGNLGTAESNLGYLYKDPSAFDKSKSYYERQLSLAKSLKPSLSEHVAKALENIGFFYLKLDQLNEALKYYQESLNTYKQVYKDNSEHVEIAKLLSIIAHTHLELNNFEYAITHGSEALKIYEKIHAESLKHANTFKTLCILGSAHVSIAQFTKAKFYFEKALENNFFSLETDSTLPAYARLYHGLGTANCELQEYLQAKKYYELALNVYLILQKDQQPNKVIAAIYGSLGNVCYHLEDYTTAKKYYLESLTLYQKFENTENQNLVYILKSLGHVCARLQDFTQSIEYYESALNIYQKLLGLVSSNDILNEIAETLYELGWEYQNRGLEDKAESTYREALKLYQRLSNDQGTLNTLVDLGNFYMEQKQYLKASSSFQETLAQLYFLHGSESNYPVIGNTLLKLAQAHGALEDYCNAKACLEKAIIIFKSQNPPNYFDMFDALQDLAAISFLEKSYQDSKKHCEEALELLPKIREKSKVLPDPLDMLELQKMLQEKL